LRIVGFALAILGAGFGGKEVASADGQCRRNQPALSARAVSDLARISVAAATA